MLSFFRENKSPIEYLFWTTILLNNQMKSFILGILELTSIGDIKLIWISNQRFGLNKYFTSDFSLQPGGLKYKCNTEGEFRNNTGKTVS